MLSANSNLNTCQLVSRLKEGALPFPQTSVGEAVQPPVCHPPTSSSDLESLECICTLDGKTCGAGMANAFGAVKAALRPIAAVAVTQGQTVALSAQNSAAAAGHSISSYQWASIGKQAITLSNATSATATATPPGCGYGTVRVTVTDDAGRADTADVVLSPTTTRSIAPTNASDKSCSVATPDPLVAVCPGAASVVAGSGTQTFAASTANVTDDSVTWEVNGIAGGNADLGTISSTGLYTAPGKVSSNTQVEIDAVLSSDQAVVGKTNLSVTAPTRSGGGGGGGAMDLLTLVMSLCVVMRAAVRRPTRTSAPCDNAPVQSAPARAGPAQPCARPRSVPAN